MSSEPQTVPPVSLPRRRGLGMATRDVMVSEASFHPRRNLRAAAIIMLVSPVLLANLMYLAAEPTYHYIALLEVLMVAGIGAWELWGGREAGRRLAVAVVLINFVLVTSFATYAGNTYIALFQAASTMAFMFLAFGRRPRRGAMKLGWATLVFVTLLLGFSLYRGRQLLNASARAYWQQDYALARANLEAAIPTTWLRTGTDADRAMLAFRRAELAIRAGDRSQSRPLTARAYELSRNLGVPDEKKEGRAAVTESFGFATGQRAIITMFAEAYALSAWGEAADSSGDMLGYFRLRPEDMLSPWLMPFVPQESRGIRTHLFLP